MKLLPVLGVGFLATSFCCCGGLVDKVKAMFDDAEPAVEAAPPVETAPVAAPVVEEKIEIGIPRGAKTQPAPEGVFLRYTHETLSVDEARQYHDQWFRENGWQVQVDNATATGRTLEAVKGAHRLTVDMVPLGGQGGVNVIYKLL